MEDCECLYIKCPSRRVLGSTLCAFCIENNCTSMPVIRMIPLDEVNAPPHYDFGTFQVIDVLEAAFPTEPLLWQVGKYILRWDRKGEALKNLKKAQWYLDRKIKKLESSKP